MRECGEIYRRVHWNNRDCKSVVWLCANRLEEKGRGGTLTTIGEEALQLCVDRAINLVVGEKDSFLDVLQKNIATVLDEQNDLDNTGIDVKLNDLQKELLRLANSGSQYMVTADEILSSTHYLKMLTVKLSVSALSKWRISSIARHV